MAASALRATRRRVRRLQATAEAVRFQLGALGDWLTGWPASLMPDDWATEEQRLRAEIPMLRAWLAAGGSPAHKARMKRLTLMMWRDQHHGGGMTASDWESFHREVARVNSEEPHG